MNSDTDMDRIQATFCKIIVDVRKALSAEGDKMGLSSSMGSNDRHPGNIGDYQCDCICDKSIDSYVRVDNLFIYFIKKAVDEYISNPKLMYKFIQDYFIQDNHPDEYDEWMFVIMDIMDKNKEKKEEVAV